VVVANLSSRFDTWANNQEELYNSSNRGPRCDTSACGFLRIGSGLFGATTYTGQGTSFSAPNVAGMAALILEKYPTTTPYQMRRFFRETAVSSANMYTGKTTYATGLGNYGDPEYFSDGIALQGFSGNIAYLDPTLPDDPTALFPSSGSYTYPAEPTAENQGIGFTTAQINTKLASI
jgi:subtilisin family serine protease